MEIFQVQDFGVFGKEVSPVALLQYFQAVYYLHPRVFLQEQSCLGEGVQEGRFRCV